MRVLQVGLGKVGRVAARLLGSDRRFEVVVIDNNAEARSSDPYDVVRLDATDPDALLRVAQGADAVVSAAPHYMNPGIAGVARRAGAHYFDLTESMACSRAIREIAKGASTTFAPHCGIAPGFICIVAAHLARRFERVQRLLLRAGSLPRSTTNRLGYNAMWSLDGVVHEYISPCPAIQDGRVILLRPMHDLEHAVIDGVHLEAFNTSGGLGTLTETFDGHVDELNYKTLRYPGHCGYMRFLLEDLGFAKQPGDLTALLKEHLASTSDDLLILHVSAAGILGGTFEELMFTHTFRSNGPDQTAIGVSTANSLCAVVDLVTSGRITRPGFLRQEDIALPEFLSSVFAGPYQAARSLVSREAA